MTSTATTTTMTASRPPPYPPQYFPRPGGKAGFNNNNYRETPTVRPSSLHRANSGNGRYPTTVPNGGGPGRLQRHHSSSQAVQQQSVGVGGGGRHQQQQPGRAWSGHSSTLRPSAPAVGTTAPLRIGRQYDIGREVGTGSFGSVYEARCVDTNEVVAIKTVLQDPRYKNRELDVMAKMHHPNVVALRDYLYTDSMSSNGELLRYLNLVMEFIPDTIYQLLRSYNANRTQLPVELVKVYTYQMLRAIGYVHSLGICHRDIKPQNLLVDTESHVLKLCDFGSAKKLQKDESSVSYICTRFYRAPELMLGATEYSKAIDIWSVGCVMAELLIGKPLFAGETSVDQLMKIIGFLGPPSHEQLEAMNYQHSSYPFANLAKKSDSRSPFDQLRSRYPYVPQEACDLLSCMLRFDPAQRIPAYEALAHPFFDSLRERSFLLSEVHQVPPLFNFSDHELRQMSSEAKEKVIPSWVQRVQC